MPKLVIQDLRTLAGNNCIPLELDIVCKESLSVMNTAVNLFFVGAMDGFLMTVEVKGFETDYYLFERLETESLANATRAELLSNNEAFMFGDALDLKIDLAECKYNYRFFDPSGEQYDREIYFNKWASTSNSERLISLVLYKRDSETSEAPGFFSFIELEPRSSLSGGVISMYKGEKVNVWDVKLQ